MRRSRALHLLIFIQLIFIGLVADCYGYGSWSLDWTQNSPSGPSQPAPFTKIEFFIMPGSDSGLQFADLTDVSVDPPAMPWSSSLPTAARNYSVVSGSATSYAGMTTYFTGNTSSHLVLDLLVWNGANIIQRQEFTYPDWSTGAGSQGTDLSLSNSSTYQRQDANPVPIPSAILLFVPAAMVLGTTKRMRWWPA